MKLAFRLLLLTLSFLLLIVTLNDSNLQTLPKYVCKILTVIGYVEQGWCGTLAEAEKESEATTTAKSSSTTTTTTIMNSAQKTKQANNNKNNDAPGRNVAKPAPPKLQQFLPSVWVYTAAHREVSSLRNIDNRPIWRIFNPMVICKGFDGCEVFLHRRFQPLVVAQSHLHSQG